MEEPAVPLILERMQSQGWHWFHAMHHITNADPVAPADRGKIAAMQESRLQRGTDNGYLGQGTKPAQFSMRPRTAGLHPSLANATFETDSTPHDQVEPPHSRGPATFY